MTSSLGGCRAAVFTGVAVLLWTGVARADDSGAAQEDWSLHGQLTFTEQYHPAFTSPYRGRNSLDPGSRGDETVDLTLFAGLRLWNGGEAYADPEIDQGFGLSDTIGVAIRTLRTRENSGSPAFGVSAASLRNQSITCSGTFRS